MKPPDEYRWRCLEGMALKPNIKTPSDYANALENGVAAAKKFLEENSKTPFFDSTEVSKVHWIIFKEIFVWAGQIRTHNSVPCNHPISQAKSIISDLQSLNLHSRDWFASNDLTLTAKQIASFNAGIHSVFPFRDGNFSTGRVIAEHQAFVTLERRIDLSTDSKVYEQALKQSLKGNFGNLANQILEHAGFGRAAERQRVEYAIETATRELREREQQYKSK